MLLARPSLWSKVKIFQTIYLMIAIRSTVWYITIWCEDSFAGGRCPCYKTNCIIVDRYSWYVLLIWSSQWWYIMKQRIIGIVMTASVTSWRHCASFQNLIFRRQANCRLRIKPYGTCMHTNMYVTQSIEGNAWSWMYIFLRKRMKSVITLCSRAK